MQLGQSEPVRAMHDDGVRGRHVNAGFNDRRAQQYVEALRNEVAHHFFQITLVHLAVRNRNACLWQQCFEHRLAVFDGFDFVMQKIHLTAALQFAQAGFANHRFAFAAYKGLDCEPLLRCCGNHGKVAQTFQCHAERARNRRCGERQHIDFRPQCL